MREYEIIDTNADNIGEVYQERFQAKYGYW